MFSATLIMAQSPVKICLTGRAVENFKSYGQSFQNTAEFAVENNKISKKIELKSYFFNNRPLEPLRVYQKMIHDGCSAIIGFEYLSDLLLALKEQKNTEIPIFSSYASTITTDVLPDNVFLFMPHYNFLANKMVEYLQSRSNKLQDVLLITEINRDDMRKYKDAYSDILNKASIPFDTYDFLENDTIPSARFSTFLGKRKYKYIFMLSGAIPSAKIANYLNNPEVVFIGTENFGSSVSQTFFMQLDNKKINAHFIRNLDFVKPGRHGLANFQKIYYEKYHENPTILSAYTYDAIQIIAKALIQNNAINTKNIMKINYRGITGAYLENNKFYRSDEYVILSINKDGYVYEK